MGLTTAKGIEVVQMLNGTVCLTSLQGLFWANKTACEDHLLGFAPAYQAGQALCASSPASHNML